MKTLLKGFFDTYGDRAHVVVTGSSRLDVLRRGGDSFMGRYPREPGPGDPGVGRHQKREVDFVVVRDRTPWFLVEAKLGDTRLSPALGYFQGQTKAPTHFRS